MAEHIHNPVGPVVASVAPKFTSATPTTGGVQLANIPCEGVNLQVPSFNDAGAAVTGYVYVSDSAAGTQKGIEIAPGEKVFIACSNLNQLWVFLITGAGGGVGFVRAEVIQVNSQAR